MKSTMFGHVVPDSQKLRRRLLAWYRRSHRDLPWRRREHDPYAQWLAEIMLQQTQVATVIPYFERFIRRFPTVQRLAAADQDEVLGYWAGLGYYRRAVNLHDAARRIVRVFHGQFPNTVTELITLPGVGRYTAGAIASIAFDARVPVLDGNVKRVLARVFGIRGDLESPNRRRRLWRLAEEILPRRSCGHFNQGMMELGATLCTPRQPACGVCPLANECRAHLAGAEQRIPATRSKPATRRIRFIVLVVTAGHRVLLRKRPDSGLWAGMWDLPCEESLGSRQPSLARAISVAGNILPPPLSARAERIARLGDVRVRLTHREVTLHGFAVTAKRVRVPTSHRWVDLATADGMPTAFQKVLKLMK